MAWKSLLQEYASDAEMHFDKLWQRLERHLNHNSAMIQPYLGYGNQTMIRLRGRVLQDIQITTQDDRDSRWQNLLNTYRRFATHEIPYSQVKASVGHHETIVTADKEGFFDVMLPIRPEECPHERYLQVQLKVIGTLNRTAEFSDAILKTTGEVIIPGSNAQYGVISDLDDTIIKSDVLHLMKLAQNTFLQNAHTRLPFEGVAALYQALRVGTANVQNPLYYVSNSPWNLYDLLTDFLELREIPTGALFLQDMGINGNQFITQSHNKHKLYHIQEILDLQSHLQFVLIGDSGQHDPEVYLQVALSNPKRIKAIFIRDVTHDDIRKETIEKLALQLKRNGIHMVLAKDSVEVATHAINLGLLPAQALDKIKAECAIDQGKLDTLEQRLDNE